MADILTAQDQASTGATVMYGTALADSADGKVLVRLDDEITAEWGEEPDLTADDTVSVDFEDDLEGSLDTIDEDADADELDTSSTGYDEAGDADSDETTADDADASDEETEDADDPLAEDPEV